MREKGITMATLAVYIIGMMIVIGVIATITIYLRENISKVEDNSQNISGFNTFNASFLEATEKHNNDIESISSNRIVFTDGETFAFVEGERKIYKDNIAICENVARCDFTKVIVNGKDAVKVYLVIGSETEFEKTIEYILNTN